MFSFVMTIYNAFGSYGLRERVAEPDEPNLLGGRLPGDVDEGKKYEVCDIVGLEPLPYQNKEENSSKPFVLKGPVVPYDCFN